MESCSPAEVHVVFPDRSRIFAYVFVFFGVFVFVSVLDISLFESLLKKLEHFRPIVLGEI